MYPMIKSIVYSCNSLVFIVNGHHELQIQIMNLSAIISHDKKCNQTPDKKCNQTPDKKCNQIPDKKCNQTPDKKCNQTPDKKCNQIPDNKENVQT